MSGSPRRRARPRPLPAPRRRLSGAGPPAATVCAAGSRPHPAPRAPAPRMRHGFGPDTASSDTAVMRMDRSRGVGVRAAGRRRRNQERVPVPDGRRGDSVQRARAQSGQDHRVQQRLASRPDARLELAAGQPGAGVALQRQHQRAFTSGSVHVHGPRPWPARQPRSGLELGVEDDRRRPQDTAPAWNRACQRPDGSCRVVPAPDCLRFAMLTELVAAASRSEVLGLVEPPIHGRHSGCHSRRRPVPVDARRQLRARASEDVRDPRPVRAASAPGLPTAVGAGA